MTMVTGSQDSDDRPHGRVVVDDHPRLAASESASGCGGFCLTPCTSVARDWQIGPKGHALRSLAMYYDRVYRSGPAWQSRVAGRQQSRNVSRSVLVFTCAIAVWLAVPMYGDPVQLGRLAE